MPPMLNPNLFVRGFAQVACFEGEGGQGGTGTGSADGGAGGQGGANGGTGTGAGGAAQLPPGAKIMTEAEINRIVETRTEQARRQQRETLAQFEALKNTLTMNDQQKAQYETELEELRKKTMTAEELKKRELQQQETKFQSDLEAKSKEATHWRTRHDQLLIDFEITQASVESRVIKDSVPFVAAYLKPNTRLVEEKDSQGNVIAYVPTVDLDDVSADGKPIKSTLPLKKAVARMRERPEFGNLFEGTARSGAGANGGQQSRQLDPSKLSQAEYMKIRKEQRQGV